MPARAAIRAVQPLPLLTHDGLRKVRVQLTDGDADGCRLVIWTRTGCSWSWLVWPCR